MLPFWFDPYSLALVLGGSWVLTVLRCGWGETRLAVRTALALANPAFDHVEAKAELAKQVREIADDGFVRAEPHYIGDGEFDYLADLLISRRSIDALLEEHERYKRNRSEAAQRASNVFEAAAESGPIMGLAGTLIALASQQTDGQTSLVAAVGLAVLSTLYGLLVANLLYAPLGTAIARRTAREESDRETVLAWLGEGLRSIGSPSFVDDRPLEARAET